MLLFVYTFTTQFKNVFTLWMLLVVQISVIVIVASSLKKDSWGLFMFQVVKSYNQEATTCQYCQHKLVSDSLRQTVKTEMTAVKFYSYDH